MMFISHSTHDKQIARKVAQALVDEGCKVWFDEWALQPGENWAKAVGEALESADTMIVLVSPESVSAGRQREEIQYALTTPRFEGRLIPVLVKPTPKMPWILEQLPLVRVGRTGAETARRIMRALEPTTVK